jgi:hypothetical protein
MRVTFLKQRHTSVDANRAGSQGAPFWSLAAAAELRFPIVSFRGNLRRVALGDESCVRWRLRRAPMFTSSNSVLDLLTVALPLAVPGLIYVPPNTPCRLRRRRNERHPRPARSPAS